MSAVPPVLPVVAVVVAADPGPWFAEALGCLVAQDCPNLSILVVDVGTGRDLTATVASVAPGAFVHHLGGGVGFGRGANEVLGMVEGAAYYLFCHDDVAPASDAARQMVEEASRSNAGIVCPKMVDWDDPLRLLSVGAGADKVGVLTPLVEPGELDQGQHDTPRDVFVAPSGATLVRADLFATLGGFDPIVADHGEDLDLCWRAQLAGARVRTAPAARVRHLGASAAGLRRGAAPGHPDAHRLRTALTCYGLLTLTWLVPLAVFFGLGEALTALMGGRRGPARRLVGELVGACERPADLLRAHRRAQRIRMVPDRTLRRRQSRGNTRLRSWLNDRALVWGSGPGVGVGAERPEPGQDPSAAGSYEVPEASEVPGAAERPPRGRRVPVTAVVAVLAGIVVIGSRGLLFHQLPAVGHLPVTSAGPGSWLRAWWSTWQPAGLGSRGASPPALGLLGLAGVVSLGAVGTLQHLVVLGPLALGPLGAYRLAGPWRSKGAQLVALVAYALVPLPFDAIAGGHWEALVVYAAAPWTLASLGRLSDSLPHPAIGPNRLAGRILALAALTAVTGALAPSFVVVEAVVAVALALGSLLVAQAPVAARLALVGLVAAAVAVLLLAPWSVGVLGNRAALFGAGSGPLAGGSFGALARFDVGPIGAGPLGWGLLVAAALPLVIGRSWRLAWASRLWVVALAGLAWAWMGGRGWVPSPTPALLLAPVAAALAGACALGVVAFEQDLPGYRFGWRQAASGFAAAALVASLLPAALAARNGRWKLPTAGASSVLAFLDGAPGGSYRILWVGSPSALPLASSPLGRGQAWATSFDGQPGVADTWSSGALAGASSITADLRLAESGRTTRLGHLLAPLGVRYLVVPNHDAPSGSGARAVPTSAALATGLAAQTDLAPLQPDPNETVYVNAAWFPVRSLLPAADLAVASASGRRGAALLEASNLTGAVPVLPGPRSGLARGAVPAGSTLVVAAGFDQGWRLRVGGTSLRPQRAFGVTMSFAVPAAASGPAVLRAGTSTGLLVAQGLEVIAWLAVGVVVVLDRRRRATDDAGPTTLDAWFEPLAPHRRRGPRAGQVPRRVFPPPPGPDDEEEWADA